MLALTGLALCATLMAFVSSRAFFSPLAFVKKLFSRVKNASVLEPVQVDKGWTVIPGEDKDIFQDWIADDDFKKPSDPRIDPALGSHLLLEFYGCDGTALEKVETVREAMEQAANRSNATVVTSSFHEFMPYGVSGAVIIQESHYTIHTWPEHGYAAVDLFYCSETVHVEKAIDELCRRFKPKRVRFLVVRRGLQPEVENK